MKPPPISKQLSLHSVPLKAFLDPFAFTYDRLSRLKTAVIKRHPHSVTPLDLQPAGSVSLNYSYDIFGNITQRQQAPSLTYTVGTDPALELFFNRSYTDGVNPVPDNKIHQAGFSYDGNGNMISDGKKDFIYDELNQQVEVHEVTTICAAAGQGTGSFNSQANAGEGGTPAAVLCYGAGPLIERNGYGPDGMRAIRDVQIAPASSQYKRQIYARLGGSVVREFTEEANPAAANAIQVSHEKTYVYGPLGLLATEELCSLACKSDEVQNAPATRYYEYDHLGTIRAITNNNGNLESTFDYEPFGLELKSANAAFTWWTDTSSNTHRFTGHERDEEAGEDYMKARMYVLSTARFPQIDPQFGGAQDPQNWNAYIYVMNSPVGSSDPTGMLPSLGNRYAPNSGGLAASASVTIKMGSPNSFGSSPTVSASAPTGTGSSGPAAAPNPAITTTTTGNVPAATGGAAPAAAGAGIPVGYEHAWSASEVKNFMKVVNTTKNYAENYNALPAAEKIDGVANIPAASANLTCYVFQSGTAITATGGNFFAVNVPWGASGGATSGTLASWYPGLAQSGFAASVPHANTINIYSGSHYLASHIAAGATSQYTGAALNSGYFYKSLAIHEDLHSRDRDMFIDRGLHDPDRLSHIIIQRLGY